MPLRPISASPRWMLWSIDVNVMLRNSGVRPRLRANSSAISTSKPVSVSGCAGSASTNGAPPSGSPAQRKTRGWLETAPAKTAKAAKIAHAKDAEGKKRRSVKLAEGGRADTGVDSMRRRRDGDCGVSRDRAARQRNSGADAEDRSHRDGLEPNGVEGTRARAARRGGGRVAGRCRRE